MPSNAAELLLAAAVASPWRGTVRFRIAAALRDAIRTGHLEPGTVQQSSRVLAQDLGVSRGPVVDAYAQLAAEGFVSSRPGGSTRVAFLPIFVGGAPPAPRKLGSRQGIVDLRPGWPDLSTFPRRDWSAAVRDVLNSLPSEALGYIEPWGAWAMRHELAYLSRVRGAVTTPDGVVVVSGVTQGTTLLGRFLLESGHRMLAVEDPGNAVQRKLLHRLGLQVVDVPVDEQGLRVDALAASQARAVLCTPAHQYPTGVVLSPGRRRQLLQWAEDDDALILEDDVDAEFRYERLPVACLQAMNPGRVVLLGSVSKTLVPALRLGWVVTPPTLTASIRGAKRDDDFGSNGLDQHVFARLLQSGGYDRHVRGLRRLYRDRRDFLVQALARRLPDWVLTGGAGGPILTILLPGHTPEGRLVATANELGLLVVGLGTMTGRADQPAGLEVSFARATQDHGQRRRRASSHSHHHSGSDHVRNDAENSSDGPEWVVRHPVIGPTCHLIRPDVGSGARRNCDSRQQLDIGRPTGSPGFSAATDEARTTGPRRPGPVQTRVIAGGDPRTCTPTTNAPPSASTIRKGKWPRPQSPGDC
jgi:GntR family transcriptional regulator/MocR family aminotransferase